MPHDLNPPASGLVEWVVIAAIICGVTAALYL